MGMDYSKLIDSVRGIACIMSLRKEKEDGKDVFTITAVNKNYMANPQLNRRKR